MRAPVVAMYHAVAPVRSRWDLTERALVVRPELFAAQIARIAAAGRRTLSLAEYERALARGDDAGGGFLLTFDDAYAGLDRVVTPVLLRHGFTAVLFVPWAHLGQLNSWDPGHPALSRLRVMSGDEVEALASGPWEIASHGARHVDLRRLDPQARQAELRSSREALSRLSGREVGALAYPFGYEDEAVRRDAAAAGYRLGFLARPYGPPDPFRLPRRALTDLDRGPAAALRLAPRPWLYRLEDAARIPLRLRRLPGILRWRPRGQAA